MTSHLATGSHGVKPIPPGLSIYLDLVRLLAAVTVVLYHTLTQFFLPDVHLKLPGHEAVVVFFVLSGYVISYTASRPGTTLSDYVQHRVARIVPVAWMALLLGLLLALAKGELPIVPALVNMLFLGQSGIGWVEAPLNHPYWSLSYEVWYYVIFGAWLFAPRRHRAVAVLVAMLLAGPKILLLLPVWLMGVWLHRNMPALRRGPALVLYVSTLCLAAALCWLDISNLLRDWLYQVFPPAWRAHYSTQFLYDILLGVVVTAHFIAAAAIAPGFGWMIRLQRPIRYLAGFSFSLYVFHAPLMELHRPGMSALVFYGGLALIVFILAQLTERRVGFFRRCLKRIGGKSSLPYLPESQK